MVLVCDWIVPCLLCEDPIEHVAVYRDDQLRSERIDRERLPHLCSDLTEIVKERTR